MLYVVIISSFGKSEGVVGRPTEDGDGISMISVLIELIAEKYFCTLEMKHGMKEIEILL